MKIRWTEEAAANLEHISLYIAQDNLTAALKTIHTIYERIEQLSKLPGRGRLGREAGTRELVLSPLPYIVAYRVRESTVEILHIWHGAQRRR
jgi:addiction module RelE/StbE family toxin